MNMHIPESLLRSLLLGRYYVPLAFWVVKFVGVGAAL
jgi:hypothetical protein